MVSEEEEVCVCVIVAPSYRPGFPSCKLLEPGQMVNLDSTMRKKTTTRHTGTIVCVLCVCWCVCVYMCLCVCVCNWCPVWCGH